MPSLADILPKRALGSTSFHSSFVFVLLCLLNSVNGHTRSDKGSVEEIRTLYPSEWSVPYPAGVAYANDWDQLFLIDGGEFGPSRSIRPIMAIITPYEDLVATVQLPVTTDDVINMAFDDASHDLLMLVNRSLKLASFSIDDKGQVGSSVQIDLAHLGIKDAEGMAVDSDTGYLYILDSGASQIVRAEIDDGIKVISKVNLEHLGNHRLRGIAIHPRRDTIFVASPAEDTLFELTKAGLLVQRYSLSALDLVNSGAITFAPSADLTDDPNMVHLYIADSNVPDEALEQGDSSYGRLLEVELIRASRSDASLCTLE